jgi:hypothetical protein
VIQVYFLQFLKVFTKNLLIVDESIMVTPNRASSPALSSNSSVVSTTSSRGGSRVGSGRKRYTPWTAGPGRGHKSNSLFK